MMRGVWGQLYLLLCAVTTFVLILWTLDRVGVCAALYVAAMGLFFSYLLQRRLVRDVRAVPYPEDWAELQLQVFARDHQTCTNCGRGGQLQAHHIVPLEVGGTNELNNLTTLCRACHTKEHRFDGPAALVDFGVETVRSVWGRFRHPLD